MTRPCVRRGGGRGGRRDEGVSSVLGAILVFGLLVVTLAVVQARFVPVWTEDREARHMETVADQFAAFASDLHRMAANQSQAGVSDPLTMRAPEGFRLFRPAGTLPGSVAFTPSAPGAGFALRADPLRLQSRNGLDFFGLGEQWTAFPAATTVQDVVRVDHLRVRVDMIPGNYSDGASATLTLTNATGAFAGRAVVTFRDFPSEQALETTVYDASGRAISSDVEAFFQQTSVDYFYVDLLDPSLLFRSVLASAAAPFDVALSRSGLDADYTLAAMTVSGPTAGQGGFVVDDYAFEAPSGRLALDARNERFPRQSYVVENGAVLVVQDDGAAMRVPPPVRVAASSTQVLLSWTMPGLAGDSAAVSGSSSVSLVAAPTEERTDLVGVARQVTLRIPTAYPAVWQAWLDDTLRAAGLSPTGGQYTLQPASGSLTLVLSGPRSDAAEDVVVELQQAAVDLVLRPSG